MKKLLCLTICLMASVCSFNATASDFNYSYFDVGLSLIDNDGADAAGIGAQLSREVSDNLRVKLFYMYSEGLDVDFYVDDLVVTAGYRLALKPQTDLVIDAGFITEWFSTNFTDNEDTGIYLAGLLRHKVDSGLELYGGASYQSLFDDSDVAANIGVIFTPNAKTSIGINGTSATVTSKTLFIRIYSD